MREDVEFTTGGVRLAAWLWRPEATGEVPLIVLGHGLGCTREMGLATYAEAFAAAGFAALTFDYRHFGASGGQPRQVLDVRRQQADWVAAISYARRLPGVDPTRIALWGSSFGGGHALAAALRDGRVAAIVSQCPFTDGIASLRQIPPRTIIGLTGKAIADLAAAALGKAPVLVPLYGAPGDLAVMTAPDVAPGMGGLTPPATLFRNEVAARISLQIGRYRPGRLLRRLHCPVLLQVMECDSLTPAPATVRHARRSSTAEVLTYPIGHFDVYSGAAQQQAIADQVAFYRRHLVH